MPVRSRRSLTCFEAFFHAFEGVPSLLGMLGVRVGIIVFSVLLFRLACQLFGFSPPPCRRPRPPDEPLGPSFLPASGDCQYLQGGRNLRYRLINRLNMMRFGIQRIFTSFPFVGAMAMPLQCGMRRRAQAPLRRRNPFYTEYGLYTAPFARCAVQRELTALPLCGVAARSS
jgi:hypothetical protein